jgi:replication initiation and membrane attachment protein DnaB
VLNYCYRRHLKLYYGKIIGSIALSLYLSASDETFSSAVSRKEKLREREYFVLMMAEKV